MDVKGSKIRALVEYYGQQKGYEEKSYLVKFTDDFSLNYKQWSNYLRGNQNVGIKIVDFLIEVFPELNMNWLLKDSGEMFHNSNLLPQLQEPTTEYKKEIDNKAIWMKLEEIHKDIKNLKKG